MPNKEKIVIDRIKSNVRKKGFATTKDLQNVERLLIQNSQDPSLWCFRGDLIQLSNGTASWKLADALNSYRRAISLDNTFQEAYVSAAYYHYAVQNSPNRAMKYLKSALKIKSTKVLLKLEQEIQKEIRLKQ
ncbi:MAG: hypothetical protein WDA22_17565 [Bacteroidota bacterium]